jgi:hypothetical protein
MIILQMQDREELWVLPGHLRIAGHPSVTGLPAMNLFQI